MRRALLLAVAIILAQTIWVGGIPPADAASPCCAITAIDVRSGIVTASETATRRAFKFKVTDPALLRTLKVGQLLFADFTARTVTLAANTRPCCSIVQDSAAAPATGSNPLPSLGQGTKSVSTNHSLLSSDVAVVATNPQLYMPDLIPHSLPFISVCSWDESQGQTCESQCPPIVATNPIGTKNISNRPLSGVVTIKVLTHPGGNLVKQWSVTDVAGAGEKMAGWAKKTMVRCGPPGVNVSSPPEPNFSLVVETGAAEADKNNNARLTYIDPASQFGP